MLPKNPYPRGFQHFEESVVDPLANVEQFNIIQFLAAENEFSLLEEQLEQEIEDQNIHMKQEVEDVHPSLQALPSLQHLSTFPQLEQLQQMLPLQPVQQMQQITTQINHAADSLKQNIFQLSNGNLPDSPPITDLGNESNSSPSNSDEPYSPDAFSNYRLGARRLINNGMILGVPEISQQNGLKSTNEISNFENRANQLTSPQNTACFMSPYPPSQPTPRGYAASISPDSQNENQNFCGNLYDQMHTSSEGSLNSTGSDAPVNRKRPRMEPSFDPTKIMSPCLGQMTPSPVPMEIATGDGLGQPMIKFSKFQEERWNALYDSNRQMLSPLYVTVVADKGFNYSTNDNCFVNQKKNHFQVSVQVESIDNFPPTMVKFNNELVPVKDFKLAFCGVKTEMLTSEIVIRQSKTDRKSSPHVPVLFEIQERRNIKVMVPRLHFSDCTANNQRKNMRPNPEQKYFYLVVRLFASVDDKNTVLIQSYASDRVIVRATNPGSFDPQEGDIGWNKNGDALYSLGPVAIGNEKAYGKLTVDGDIYTTGRVICPSDLRLKENIVERETSEALENLCKLRIVDYFYKPEVAEKWGLTEEQRKRTGVIAQELAGVLPDAVRDIGEYLTVNESRVFYETVMATQELCRLTGDLDQKIDEKVAEISERLARYAARKKLLSSKSSNLNSDGDGKSLMSSRSSLNSTLTFRNTRRNGRRISEKGESLCGSKLAQATMIFLVAVMTLSLVTMSVLYVLDWHNRNYGFHHGHPPEVPIKDGPANIIMTSPGDHVPYFQPYAPPIIGHCSNPSCKNYCCESSGRHENDINIDQKQVVSKPPESKSDYPYKSFGKGVEITLPQFDLTIDSRYCIEKSCNRKRMTYNLFIPIGKYMPVMPIEVEFKIPRSKVINNCGHLQDFDHKRCQLNSYSSVFEVPRSLQATENVYELTVGYFLQSAYRFRVSHTTEACFQSEEGLGGNFEEYNLIFYRNCGNTTDNNSNTITYIKQ